MTEGEKHRSVMANVEESIFKRHLEMCRKEYKEILEEADEWLRENRDKQQFATYGTKSLTLKTLFGEVTFERRLYRTKDMQGNKKSVFLLDELLQPKAHGNMTEALEAKIIELHAAQLSYLAISQELAKNDVTLSRGGVHYLISTKYKEYTDRKGE